MRDVYHPTIGFCYLKETFFFNIFSIVQYWTFENTLESSIVLTKNLKYPVRG